jgi:hypothetical protein
VEPEETDVARQWLGKHASTASRSRDSRNTYTGNNKRNCCWKRCFLLGPPRGYMRRPAQQASRKITLTLTLTLTSSEEVPTRGVVTSSTQTSPLVDEEGPYLNHKSLERTKIWSWVPTGPKTKNDCAG